VLPAALRGFANVLGKAFADKLAYLFAECRKFGGLLHGWKA
jgi:hypothetical protein